MRSFLTFFSIMAYPRPLGIGPCAIRPGLVVYPSCMFISSLHLLIPDVYSAPSPTPWKPKSVLNVCESVSELVYLCHVLDSASK